MFQFLYCTFKTFVIALFSLSIVACDGFDFDSADGAGTTPERTFTRTELAYSLLYSPSVLNNSGLSNNSDGFIVLFNDSASLDEIELKANGNNSNALIGNYPWTIVNDKLQVTYPNGVTCTSTKTDQTSSQFTASNSCDGGEPENDRIRNTLLKPNSFDKDDIAGKTITINDGDNDQKIEFYDNNNGTFEIKNLDSAGNEITTNIQSGTVEDSDINKVVKLKLTDTFRRLILLDGNLSLGTMLELKYKKPADSDGIDTLTEVLIYNIKENNKWVVQSRYDDITIDE